MPFSNVYRVENYSDSILSFFGYESEEVEASYQQGVWLDDDRVIGGKRKVYGTQYYKLKQLTRKHAPKGKELELEDKFIAAVINSGNYRDKVKIGAISGEPYLDAERLPPIIKSLPKYYETRERGLNGFQHFPLYIITIISIVICALWFAFYTVSFPLFEQVMGYDIACVVFVFVVPILILLIFAVIRKIIDHKESKRYSAYINAVPHFHELSNEQKEAVRQRYFQYMTQLYGDAAGRILQEYARLKKYDKF